MLLTAPPPPTSPARDHRSSCPLRGRARRPTARDAIRRLPTRFALAVALLLAFGATARPAVAQTQPTGPDRLELIRLAPAPATQRSDTSTLQLEARLNYRLQSAPRASLLMFIFENNAETSTQQDSEAISVPAGAGQVTLNVAYRPRPDVRTVAMVIGLFKDDQTLLAWVSTNPISLAPWPGRAQFDQAMVARVAGNWAEAVERLSLAIEAAPETSNYYFWRADTLIRLARYDDAIADYARALELAPNDRASLVGRGVALLWEGAWPSAIEDLTRAIDVSQQPDRWTAWAYRARGLAYAGLNRRAEAVADYQAYLSLSPGAPDTAEVEGWIAALS